MREEMLRYIAKRLLWLPFFLLIVSFIVFTVGRFGPGDPALLIAGPQASTETIERIRHNMGLDQPILVQYLAYMARFIRGDLGESMVYIGQPVSKLLAERMVISGSIVLIALAISLVVGIGTGLVASFKKGTRTESAILGVFLFFGSIPSLILVQFAILVFSFWLHILPAKWSGSWESVFTLQIVIPVFVLWVSSVSDIARYVRATTLKELDENYVRFAKAKGLPNRVIAMRYVLRNALLPLVTLIIPAIFGAISGSFFIEFLYGIPGTGQFMVTALFQRDYPVITGFIIILAVLSMIANLLQDITYAIVDPRAQVTKRSF